MIMKLVPSFSVSMDIIDVLYLSHLIPIPRISPYIPKPLTPAPFANDKVFLSVVCFRSKNVRLAGVPFMKFSYDQINIRTYVKDPISGKNGVLFLFSGIDSSFISLSTNILGFPWKNMPFRLKTLKDENNQFGQYHAAGIWNGTIDIKIAEATSPPLPADPSHSFGDAAQYITSPTLGFYNIKGSALRFEVRHTEIKPRRGRVLCIDFPFLTSSGLLTTQEMTKPESTILADKGTFTVHLPPQKIRAERDLP
jgi:hypothetical protein